MKTHALPLFILFSSTVMLHAQTYPIVSTGQSNCFDTVAVIAPSLPGQPCEDKMLLLEKYRFAGSALQTLLQ